MTVYNTTTFTPAWLTKRRGIAALDKAARHTQLAAWLETDLRARFAGRILPIDESVGDRWGSDRRAGGGPQQTAFHHRRPGGADRSA